MVALSALCYIQKPTVAVTVQGPVYSQGPAVTSRSTLGRELTGLISHATHHLAMVA